MLKNSKILLKNQNFEEQQSHEITIKKLQRRINELKNSNKRLYLEVTEIKEQFINKKLPKGFIELTSPIPIQT